MDWAVAVVLAHSGGVGSVLAILAEPGIALWVMGGGGKQA